MPVTDLEDDDCESGDVRKRSKANEREQKEEEEEEEELDEGDEDEEETDDSDDEADDPNEIRVIKQTDTKEIFNAIHGGSEDVEEFDARLATFGKEEWSAMAQTLFRSTLDTNCSDKDLFMTFRLFYQLFCFRYQSDHDVIDRVQSLYPDVTTMHDQKKRIIRMFGVMHFELTKRRFINDDTRHGREIKSMLTRIAFCIKFTFEQMVTARLLQKGNDKSMKGMLEEMNPLTMFREVDVTKKKKHQQLLHFYYHLAFKNNYRKDGECLYKPRYNEQDQFVHAYEYVCDISDFVFQGIFPLEQNDYWLDCLTEKPGTASSVISQLTNLKSEWLKDLERNSMVHAFQNGLFILCLNRFFYFTKRPGKHWVGELAGNITAVKYHNQDFREEMIEREMTKHGLRSYMAIEMTPIHTILNTQEFDMEERKWIFALLGRLLYPLGKKDTWGVFVYFLGLAGTGKSTLLRLTAALLEARDVGYLNNSLQKTFALEGIINKLLYLALDIDEHFQLDQATFQSMVVGEEVAVLRKYKKPTTVVWNIHGGFAGNKLPPWTDNGGSLSRRLIVVEFTQVVGKCDPALFEKCLANKDKFLYVINSAYGEMCHKFKDRGIKEVIPKKFKKSESKALLELNVLVSFLQKCCIIDQEKQKSSFTNWNEFCKCFKDYCKRNSIRPKTMNYTFYSGPFSKYQIKRVEVHANKPDPFGQKSTYVLGARLKPEEIAAAEGS